MSLERPESLMGVLADLVNASTYSLWTKRKEPGSIVIVSSMSSQIVNSPLTQVSRGAHFTPDIGAHLQFLSHDRPSTTLPRVPFPTSVAASPPSGLLNA